MRFRIETELEEDGRWIAVVKDLPGVMVYGETKREAIDCARDLALWVVADRATNNEASDPL